MTPPVVTKPEIGQGPGVAPSDDAAALSACGPRPAVSAVPATPANALGPKIQALTLASLWSRDGTVEDAVKRLFAIGAGNCARIIQSHYEVR